MSEPISIIHDGRERIAWLTVPAVEGTTPLLILLHGGEGGPDQPVTIIGQTRFHVKAAEEGFPICYPLAVDGESWQGGQMSLTDPPDDVGFIRALITRIRLEHSVSQVFIAGASSGGALAIRLAYEMPEQIAGVSVVIMTLSDTLDSVGLPLSPVPGIWFHSTEDPFMPFGGGLASSPSGTARFCSADETVDRWRVVNDCMGPTDETIDELDDGTSVIRQTFEQSKLPVEWYRISGGGHRWPGTTYPAHPSAGIATQEIDATDRTWGFFRHSSRMSQ